MHFDETMGLVERSRRLTLVNVRASGCRNRQPSRLALDPYRPTLSLSSLPSSFFIFTCPFFRSLRLTLLLREIKFPADFYSHKIFRKKFQKSKKNSIVNHFLNTFLALKLVSASSRFICHLIPYPNIVSFLLVFFFRTSDAIERSSSSSSSRPRLLPLTPTTIRLSSSDTDKLTTRNEVYANPPLLSLWMTSLWSRSNSFAGINVHLTSSTRLLVSAERNRRSC